METLDPHQLADEGQAEYLKKEYLSAARLYKSAADGLLAAGDEVKAAEMANNSSVAFFKGGNPQAALEAAAGTDSVFASKGDMKQQAIALGNQAAALEMLKKFDDAMATYEKSAALFADLGETELRAYVLQAISTIHLRKRKYLEAYASMRAGIMGIKKPNLRQKFLKSLIQIPFKLMR